MATKKLTKNEAKKTNGGSSTSSSNSGLAGALDIDNLVSGGSASKNGDQSKASEFSIGNGIGGNLDGILDKGSRNS